VSGRGRAIVATALAAGISFANLAVALPLVVLARGGRPSLAGMLLAANILAYALGALLAFASPRPQAALSAAMAALLVGGLAGALGPGLAGPAAGGLVQGAGMGLFWVGTQSALGRRAGTPGSAAAFADQYALYVVGTIAGAICTGAVIAGLRLAGAGTETSLRMSLLLGSAAALGALLPLASGALAAKTPPLPAGSRLPVPLHGLYLQLPDFLLVAALSTLGSLAPVVLRHDFHLSPALVALATTATAAAKAGGSLAAGRVARALGGRRTAAAMLAGSAGATWLLGAADHAAPFTALLALAILLGAGAWPLCVDGALARVAPADRSLLTIAWNLREPAAMALGTIGGGYLLDLGEGRPLLAAVAGGLFAAASVATLAVFKRPMYAPGAA
jgi:MFS family permease